MIYAIYSDMPTFKNLKFNPGMNLLLADKSPGATDRQTRNRAGKTSLIELIHFLMGSNCDRDSIFRTDELSTWVFGIKFDLGDGLTSAERSGEKPSKIKVDTQDKIKTTKCLLMYDWDYSVLSNANWKKVLGTLMFDLKEQQQDDDDESGKGGPSFRSLFSYFVRRQSSGGFNSHKKTSTMQKPGDFQTSISFLLGLDWTIPQQWQVVREREKSLKTLRTEAAKGTFGSMIGTAGDLRTQLTLAEESTRKLAENVAAFQVLPEYRSLEAEASALTHLLGELADENTIDLQLINELEAVFRTETPPALTDLERLYNEAGVVLPQTVARRFEDVRLFHESVVHNRETYLHTELDAAKRRIIQREAKKEPFGERYAAIMSILKSHGALDQFSNLRSELTRHEVQTEQLRQRYAAAEQLEGTKTELDIERERLLVLLRQDYREQVETLRRAIVVFEEMSSNLYEEAGSLTIDATRNGPDFLVNVQGDKSKGITNMEIFCFDMMVMQLCAERGIGPGFLVHDSHLFDGVDERQVAKALQLAAQATRKFGFQYIAVFNSDALPKDLPKNFKLDEFILPIRLTDATEDGGLFGIRFG
jgi:uncharacterized protein YydD (DUF2326 family)